MSALACGLAMATRRLFTRRVGFAWLAAVAAVMGVALAERKNDAAQAATNSLAGVALGLCIR